MKAPILLLLTALTLFSCSEKPQETKPEQAKPVKILTVGSASKTKRATLPGTVIAGEEASITFKISGKLEKLPVKEGMTVAKGAIIAQLDQKDYRFAYERQLATFNENKSSYARAQELIKNKYISQADFDTKKKAFEVAQADLNIAKTNLDYTTLTAPFTGTIAKVYVDNYQNIQVKEPIVTLQNLDFLDVKVNVPEKRMVQANNIDKLEINVVFDANPNKSYSATVHEMANRADQATQTYPVTVRLPRPQGLNILPGMTATVRSVATLKTNNIEIITIPADAIFADNNSNSFVWVINQQNRLEKRQIQATELKADQVEISKGLNSGENIVIAGVNFLQEDQLVTEYK